MSKWSCKLFLAPFDDSGNSARSLENAPDSVAVKRFKETFPSVSGNGERFIESIVKEMEARLWSPADLFHVQMALEEAITNAIEHGNKHDPSKQVDIQAEVADKRVFISIQDQGEGFSENEVPDPTDESNLDKPSGRGLFLIRSFMSKVWHNERGNCIYLEKQRDAIEE